MGFIPETVFRTPASSVVGTAGVDRSGEIIGKSFARAAGQITSVLLEKEAERKRTLDIVGAKAKARETEAEMDANVRTVQERFAGDPQAGVKELSILNETLINSTLAGMTDEDRRAMFASDISTITRTKNREIRSWAMKQEVVNASQDFTLITDTNAAQLMLQPNEDKFWNYIAENKKRTPSAKDIYGNDWSDAIKKGDQSMAKGL